MDSPRCVRLSRVAHEAKRKPPERGHPRLTADSPHRVDTAAERLSATQTLAVRVCAPNRRPTAAVPPGKGLLPQESKHPVWLPSRGGSTNTHPSGSSCGREPNTGRSAAHKNGASDSPSSGFTRSNRFTKVDSTASITSSRSSAPGRHSRSIGHTPGHSMKRSVSASLDLPANGGCQLIRGEPLCVTRGTRR